MIFFLIGLFIGVILGFTAYALWVGRTNTADFSHEKVIDLAVEKEKQIRKVLNERGQ